MAQHTTLFRNDPKGKKHRFLMLLILKWKFDIFTINCPSPSPWPIQTIFLASFSIMASNVLRIWYLLVDASGNAFKNTTADKVSVPSDADIGRSVKTKNTKDLASIDSCHLRVFKNKDALSGEPLDEETPVSGLVEAGKRKKDALLVLVPAISAAVSVFYDGILVPLDSLFRQSQSSLKIIEIGAELRPLAEQATFFFIHDIMDEFLPC